MQRERYPADWERIAFEVKEAAGWKCEQCGKQCRRPGEPFDAHRRTLTVAHLNRQLDKRDFTDGGNNTWNEEREKDEK